ncbi:MAG: alpha/beta hydrolase [Sediminicola sp.]
MKNIFTFLFFAATTLTCAQEMVFKKGIVMDSVQVMESLPKDSIRETFALYLPKDFEASKTWPVIFLLDNKARGRQLLRFFHSAAERQGYILAASNNLSDTLSTANTLLMANRMFNRVISLFPIDANRIYTAGIENGGRLASIFPVFLDNIEGVVSLGGTLANSEVLGSRKPFHYIGIADKNDFNYITMLSDERILNTLKFQNQLLPLVKEEVSYGVDDMERAMEILTLAAMAKGKVPEDKSFVEKTLKKRVSEIDALIGSGKLLEAEILLEEVQTLYRLHTNVDALREKQKALRKEKMFKTQKRNENNALYKESLIKQDYGYYMEEDLLSYNYSNLGWWKYQMEELGKFGKSADLREQQMGNRLSGFVNALIDDNINIIMSESPQDIEALLFLWMLKTITAPEEASNYLKVISYSSMIEDYGTSLFYLEELLKKGYKDKAALYSLEHTALLRIAPEFNKVVDKYLKEARY